MDFSNTEKLLKKKLKDEEFDSYAVLIHYGNNEKTFFSPNTDAFTYFDVASMGKVLVTSTLILQAISRGKLKLENTLGDFFEIADEEKKNITIKHLLTHTSGIIRYPISSTAVKNGRECIAQEIISHSLAYKTGTDYIYSCNGYILLGFILEKIYGLPLEEIYNINIAKPLELKRTSFEIGFDEENAAVCYRWKDGGNQRFDDENILVMGEVAGSGGEQSCLYDIQKFITAVMEKNELLYQKNYFELAEKNYTPFYSEGRGLGYLVTDEKYSQTGKLFPIGSFGHCGHTGQSFFINREKNIYVIILTNATRFANMKNNFNGYDYGDIMKMREEIHNAILRDLEEKIK